MGIPKGQKNQLAEIERRVAYNDRIARADINWRYAPDSIFRLLTDAIRVPEDLRDISWGILCQVSKRLRNTLLGHHGKITSVPEAGTKPSSFGHLTRID